MDVSSTCRIIHHRPFLLSLYLHIKHLIVPDSGMALVPRQMINGDLDTECESDMESDSKVNDSEEVNDEEVNLSGVVTVSG